MAVKQFRVEFRVEDYDRMRYPTVGDWFVEGVEQNLLVIVAASTGDARYDHLLQLHEFIEATAYLQAGGSEQEVTDWDLAHIDDDEEPGDLPGAPYNDAHMLAMIVERAEATMLGVDWAAYEVVIDLLYEKQKALPRDHWPLLRNAA